MGALDSIVNAPRQQKIIFGVMLLVIVGALSYFLLISPAATDRDGLQQQNEVLRAEVLKARADEANLRPFRAQAEALRKRLETAKERLPSEREIPRLYRQVSDLASQAGLGVALFQPKNPEDRDVLTEVPIAVTVECSYNQLGAFFEKLGQLPRIVSLISSATEIVCALGFEHDLVGRSHECDFPPSIRHLPVCTAPKFPIDPRALRRRPSPARRLPLPRPRRPRANRARPDEAASPLRAPVHRLGSPRLLWRGRGASRRPSADARAAPGRCSSRSRRFRLAGRERRQAEGP